MKGRILVSLLYEMEDMENSYGDLTQRLQSSMGNSSSFIPKQWLNKYESSSPTISQTRPSFNTLNHLSLLTIILYEDKPTMGRILKEMGVVDDSILLIFIQY